MGTRGVGMGNVSSLAVSFLGIENVGVVQSPLKVPFATLASSWRRRSSSATEVGLMLCSRAPLSAPATDEARGSVYRCTFAIEMQLGFLDARCLTR